MNKLLLIGTNHRLVDPSQMGSLPRGEELLELLEGLRRDATGQAGKVAGFVALTTCNRYEIYLELRESQDEDRDFRILDELLPGLAAMPCIELRGLGIARHLLRVASSLESMVLGENQILGQVKTSWDTARSHKSLTTALDELFKEAVSGAKEVRRVTGLGTRPVSVASLSVRHLADRLVINGRRPIVALVGAGDMVRKAAPALAKLGCYELLFVNRTEEKAHEFADVHGGRVMALRDFLDQPPLIDAMLVAVSCPKAIVDWELVDRISAVRAETQDPEQPPLELVDLGVPACIDPRLRERTDARLLDMDTLRRLSRQHVEEREAAAEQAEPIVEAHTAAFRARQRQKRLDLGQVHRSHLSLAEEQTAQLLAKNFSHLCEVDREALHKSLLDLAKAHAYLHLKDLKTLAAEA